MKKTTTLLLALIVLNGFAFSNSSFFKDIYGSPGVTFGYTFGVGFNWGLELDLGLAHFDNEFGIFHSGASLSVSWVKQKRNYHNLITLNLMVESDNYDFKIGYGIVRTARNNYIYSTSGLNLDMSFTTDHAATPWIGYKTFRYNDDLWEWTGKQYNSAYIKYKNQYCLYCEDDAKFTEFKTAE